MVRDKPPRGVGMRRGFASCFRHLDDLFAPQNFTLSTILFRSCWVPFRSPPLSACRRSFCSQNWPNLSFYSDLVGSHFELRAVHPYWFWPGVPPPPSRGARICETGLLTTEVANYVYVEVLLLSNNIQITHAFTISSCNHKTGVLFPSIKHM